MEHLLAWVGVLIHLLLAAFIYGGVYNQTKNNTNAIGEVNDEQEFQWSHINRNRENIGKIKGRLGMNGEAPELPPPTHRRAHGASA